MSMFAPGGSRNSLSYRSCTWGIFHTKIYHISPGCPRSSVVLITVYYCGLKHHLLSLSTGRGMIVEHYRGGQKLPDLVNTDSYSYDSPVTLLYVRHTSPLFHNLIFITSFQNILLYLTNINRDSDSYLYSRFLPLQ